MTDMDTTEPPAPRRPVFASTEISPEDGNPAYVVHPADEVPPLVAPRCGAACWCKR
jgi:hypothetical protein